MFRINPFKVSFDGGSGMTKLFQLTLHLPAIGRGCWKRDREFRGVSWDQRERMSVSLVMRYFICNGNLRWNCADTFTQSGGLLKR